MRIRFKPWARPELEASDFYRDNPEELKDKWIKEFKNQNNPINLELGCGKGQFIAQLAVQNPDINYIAIDLVDAMLGLAKRNVEQVYREQNKEVENLILTRFDIERITMILGKQDNIKRIYINFCNPWPKGKHRKKRLTHTRQLEKYNTFVLAIAFLNFFYSFLAINAFIFIPCSLNIFSCSVSILLSQIGSACKSYVLSKILKPYSSK